MMNYQDLLTLRENLKKRLEEVESDIKKYDLTIYKGKLEKAISLLKECQPLLSELVIIHEYEECAICDNSIGIVIYLAEIILGLEKTVKDFEKYARIP